MSQWSPTTDGGWQYGEPVEQPVVSVTARPADDSAGDLVAYDPDNPVDHTLTVAEPPGVDPLDVALVACPTCGGGVHPDRIRS